MERETYHHRDLAEALLVAAERLVAARGVAAFSLREAAREVGVDPAACYRHFRDKDALFQALGRRGFTRLAAAMEAGLGGSDSPSSQIVALGRAYVGFAFDYPALFRTMFGPTGMEAGDPRKRGDYPEGRGPYGLLERAVRARLDEVGSPLALDAAVLIVWSGAHRLASLIVDGAIRPSEADRHRQLDALLAALIELLGRPRERQRRRRA